MDKVLIRQHLNTIYLCMNIIQLKIEALEDAVKWNSHFVSDIEIIHDKEYIEHLKNNLCDLDTIRQEYQKELDK